VQPQTPFEHTGSLPLHAVPLVHWPATHVCGVFPLHCCALPEHTSHTPPWQPIEHDDSDIS
jgi:hypothetical protein